MGHNGSTIDAATGRFSRAYLRAYLCANTRCSGALHRTARFCASPRIYRPRRGSGFSAPLPRQNNAKETTGWRVQRPHARRIADKKYEVVFGARALVICARMRVWCTRMYTRAALCDVWRARGSPPAWQNRVKSKRPHAEAAIRKQNGTKRAGKERRNKKRDAKSIAHAAKVNTGRPALSPPVRPRRDALFALLRRKKYRRPPGSVRVIDLFVYLGRADRRTDRPAKRISCVSFGIFRCSKIFHLSSRE